MVMQVFSYIKNAYQKKIILLFLNQNMLWGLNETVLLSTQNIC